MKNHTRYTVLVFAALLGTLGCSDKKRPSGSSASTSTSLAAGQSVAVVADESQSAAAVTTEPDSEPRPDDEVLEGWGELRRTQDPQGRAVVTISDERGKTLEIVNSADAGDLEDGSSVRFTATKLGNLSSSVEGADAVAVMSVKAGGPSAKLAAAPAQAAPVGIPAAIAVGVPPVYPSTAATPDKWLSRHGMTASVYQTRIDQFKALGYRPKAVHAQGSASSARFTAVWVKDGKPWSAVHGLTSSQYQAAVESRAASGLRVESVTAYGSYPNERYVATFVKDGKPWTARHRMTRQAYQAEFSAQGSKGLRPVWLQAIGNAGAQRYTAVWVKSGAGFASKHDRTRSEFQDDLRDVAKLGYRLVCVSETGSAIARRYAALWVKAQAKGGQNMAFHQQTSAQYTTTSTLLLKDGFRPVCAIQTGSANAPRFTSCWRIDGGRDFRGSGFGRWELQAAKDLEKVMHDYMKDRRVFNGALCLYVDGEKIVDRAYTNGPKSMADTKPWTRHRIASCSKPITALGILRLVDQGKLSLNTTVGQIFGELSFKDSRFKNVTVMQLLEHEGGFDRTKQTDPVYNDFTVAKVMTGSSKNLPNPPYRVLKFAAENYTLDYTPGTQSAYANFGYFLLGRIIERRAGQNYEAFMKAQILTPAGTLSLRRGRTRFHQRPVNTVIHLDAGNGFSRDVMGSDQITPIQYGKRNSRNRDSLGAWISRARDMVTLARKVDAGAVLSPAMTDVFVGDLGYPGHNGGLEGTSSYWRTYRSRGVVYFAVVNSRKTGADDHWSRKGDELTTRLLEVIKSRFPTN